MAPVRRPADLGHNAEILGVPLYGTFANAAETPSPTNTRIMAVILIILLSMTSLITQHQLRQRNIAGDNPVVEQMRMMMFMQVLFAVGGLVFPIGVLIYWFSTILWTMGQQFWAIRNEAL